MRASFHRWSGLTLASNRELPELPPGDPVAVPSWTTVLSKGRAPARPGRRWFHRWEFPDGRRWALFAREGRGYVVRFVDYGDFEIDIDRRVIHGYRRADAPEHTQRHLLLDQVLPLVVGDHDHLAVHASVVQTDRGALVLLGASGHGKSSLAARLAQRGHAVLTDDCCVIRKNGARFEVIPSYPGVRLRPDAIAEAWGRSEQGAAVAHYSTKLRLDGAHGLLFSDVPVPVGCIYVIAPLAQLEAARAISIDDLSPRRAMLDLVDYTFHLDIHDEARLRRSFELAGDVAAAHPSRALVFPWNLSEVDRVADAVLNSLR
jgi:hypothetical protein